MCEDRPANASCQAGDTVSGSEPGTTQQCPLRDQVELVELKEYVEHDGTEELREVDARRQYINLDDQVDTSAAHPEYGRKIRLKAKLRWKRGNQSRSLEGQTVYWYDERDANNRGGLTGNERPGFNSEGSDTNRTTKTTDADGWTTEPVDYYVSRYGGDKFEVFATDKDDYTGGLKAGAYEVWKKMWYEICEMSRPSGGGRFEMPAGSIMKIKASYEKVFVEMTDAGGKDEGAHQENFDTHTAADTWADGFVNNVGVPWKVHYSIVDHVVPIANREEKSMIFEAAGATAIGPDYFIPFTYGARDWLKSAKYKKADGTWGNFAAGKVTLVSPSGEWRKPQVDFSGTGITPTAAAKTEVEVVVYHAPGYNGWGGANLHLVICRGAMEQGYSAAELETAMAGTGIHEPGHALGLVYDTGASYHDAAHNQHCRHRTDCVMWYQGYTGRPLDFHEPSVSDPGCHTFMRGKDMKRSEMNAKWKVPR